MFRTKIGETIFNQKYRHAEGCNTWTELAKTLANEVCGEFLLKDEVDEIARMITNFEFIPGGRYLYYAGRKLHAYNNCFMLRLEEDTRESWAELMHNTTSCLMLGGGIGVDYSIARPSGSILSRTGGIASGPISLMKMVNEAGRYIMQGGSRRSAIYASLNWQHGDIKEFLHAKDWHDMRIANAFNIDGDTYTFSHAKIDDFNHPAPLDMTNISINYDDEWRKNKLNKTFIENCAQAMRTGEPGFSFNFGEKQNETLRNACCELTSEDDSDVCNLGSINIGIIDSLARFIEVVELATKFLICGTIVGDLPYSKVYDVREKNRRLGLGLMGVHEFLLKNGYRYEWNDKIEKWANAYEAISNYTANSFCNTLDISSPKGVRAIAPTGTISMLAGTSSGLEPIYAVAYKRRYLKNGTEWHYQYQVDGTAQAIIDRYGVNPESIETSIGLAKDYERRIRFQYHMQKHVDHAISSTINLPAWGSEYNHEGLVMDFARCIAEYAHGLRGLTFYPDGSRGGQPLTPVDYNRAVSMLGKEFREKMTAIDVCSETGHGGVCGV